MTADGNRRIRTDKLPGKRMAYERNRKVILASQTICGICGLPVDKSLKYPDPLSPTVDHIIPVSRGGDPTDIDNLQLAHFICNTRKSDKLRRTQKINRREDTRQAVDNRNLPLSYDWIHYRSDQD